jgi:hypothetical protein
MGPAHRAHPPRLAATVLADTTLWALAGTAPLSFVAGVAVGFLLSSRYRLVRRGDENETT